MNKYQSEAHDMLTGAGYVATDTRTGRLARVLEAPGRRVRIVEESHGRRCVDRVKRKYDGRAVRLGTLNGAQADLWVVW